MSHEYPNIISKQEDGSITLFAFVLARGGQRGMLVTPTGFSVYVYKIQDNILQSTSRLGKMFQASAVNEMDVITAQAEAFTTTYVRDPQSGQLDELTTQREYIRTRTDFKNEGPQAESRIIEE